jgi:hypothetical protein
MVFTFTYMCTHYLGHFHPHPTSDRTCSAFFVEEKTKDNKKNIVVLLVCDKDSYTERFLVFFTWTYVLQPTLVHLYQTSSLLPSPFPIAASASLRLLYSLLLSKHINHFQVLGFLPFPIPPHVCSPLSVWPMSNNIIAFVLGL